MQSTLISCFMISVAVLSLVSGCGRSDLPPLGTVSGKVTLDGEPLSGVIINFKPEEGRAATATTDAQGNYTLTYTYRVAGTKTGPSTVMFEWPLGEPGRAIPTKYTGLNSELKVDVGDGDNELNFPLTSR
ncbi:MAG: hypothetical protein ACF788_04545 [Novipirellula sp. JB048]